jgi:toxin-antitoxin system PIN domain toxin
VNLFDINLLISLFDPEHAHHDRATRWAVSRPDPAWATCELTLAGFIRVLGNPKATKNPRSADEAWSILRANLASGHHRYLGFAPDKPPRLERILARCQGHNQVTDALLIQLAISHSVRLATFDAKLRHLSPDPDAVEVIPLN